jgi:hypothetical protein
MYMYVSFDCIIGFDRFFFLLKILATPCQQESIHLVVKKEKRGSEQMN